MDTQDAFSLISIPYVDYVLTCPMVFASAFSYTGNEDLSLLAANSLQILADMFLAMRMQGILLATSLCLSSLICAVMTFQTNGMARGLMFGLGFILFIALFAHVFSQLRKRLPQLPAASMTPLYIAMVSFHVQPLLIVRLIQTRKHSQGMFFGMWPLFPILWIFGPAALSIIPMGAYSLLHAALDVACKSVFAIALQAFRICMEDTGIFYSYTLLNPAFKAVIQANIKSRTAQE